MSKFLVTGAAGFIGSHLVHYLLNHGHEVVGLDNFCSGKQDNLDFLKTNPNIEKFLFIQGDLREYADCLHAVRGIDFILHHAALGSVPKSIEDPLSYNDVNITGTLNLLMAASQAKVKRFVLASSSAIYGDTDQLPIPESVPLNPKSPYAIGKAAGEYYCKVFYEQFGLNTVMLRYFNVFGPRQNPFSDYAAVIPIFVHKLAQNQAPTIYGDGLQTRDFIYVENVAKANLLCCEDNPKLYGKAFNIGTGDAMSVNQLFQTISTIMNKNIPVIYAPPRSGDIKNSVSDNRSALQNIGNFIDFSFEEGLKKLISTNF